MELENGSSALDTHQPQPGPETSGRRPHAVMLGCGSSHSVALLSTGLVLSWGRGEDGQLGHGDAEERPLPQTVHTITDSGIDFVTCGAEYSIAVSTSRQEVYSWGWGDFGRLGHGDIIDVFIPKPIAGLSGIGVTMVACGDTHTLAVTASGRLFSFGRNQNGQLGTGDDEDYLSPVPVDLLKDEKVTSIACGAEHSLISTETGKAYSWGWGRYGNLGLGSKQDRWSPNLVPGLESHFITKIACGWRHSVVLNKEGKLWTFGWNRYGQLGIGNNTDWDRVAPVERLADANIKLVSGGWRHSIASDDQGRLFSWGWNKFGQLGIGNMEDKNTPQRVSAIPNASCIVHMAAGWRHNFVVTEDGDVYSWGRGCTGQLGHGSSIDKHVPTLMTDLSVSTIDPALISARGAPPTEGTSYVPFADRYAVVPDHGISPGSGLVVPEIQGPDVKRHCS